MEEDRERMAAQVEDEGLLAKAGRAPHEAREFEALLDRYSLEEIVELKIGRFFDQLGTFYPDGLYDMVMKKAEKPLIRQILRRTGGNQVHAARILGINRNTLRKKIKVFGF